MAELLTHGAELHEEAVTERFHEIVDELSAIQLSEAQESEIDRTVYMKVNGRMDDGYSEEAVTLC